MNHFFQFKLKKRKWPKGGSKYQILAGPWTINSLRKCLCQALAQAKGCGPKRVGRDQKMTPKTQRKRLRESVKMVPKSEPRMGLPRRQNALYYCGFRSIGDPKGDPNKISKTQSKTHYSLQKYQIAPEMMPGRPGFYSSVYFYFSG